MKNYTPVNIPTEANYRFGLKVQSHDPRQGGAGIVTLERQVFGPIWTEMDARAKDGFTKMSPPAQKDWAKKAETELIEEWFAQEIYDLRQ